MTDKTNQQQGGFNKDQRDKQKGTGGSGMGQSQKGGGFDKTKKEDKYK